MGDTVGYKPDARGQLELADIDTPMGEMAEKFIAAAIKAKKAIESRDDAMLDLANEMKATNIRTLKFKGEKLVYQPGHTTKEKIKFMAQD